MPAAQTPALLRRALQEEATTFRVFPEATFAKMKAIENNLSSIAAVQGHLNFGVLRPVETCRFAVH
eukprot:3461243-Amphidinium_carterae.1